MEADMGRFISAEGSGYGDGSGDGYGDGDEYGYGEVDGSKDVFNELI